MFLRAVLPGKGPGLVPGSVCSGPNEVPPIGHQHGLSRHPCVDTSDQRGSGRSDQRALERRRGLCTGQKGLQGPGWGSTQGSGFKEGLEPESSLLLLP